MEKKDLLTKILAILSAALVWLPVLATVTLTTALFLQRRIFRFDYLMPAELFPLALLGGLLLFWAALRARSRRGLIGGRLGIAVGMLVGGQALEVVTGLASGQTEPVGLPWALVVTSLGVYTLALVVMGVGGALLVRDLFTSLMSPAKSG